MFKKVRIVHSRAELAPLGEACHYPRIFWLTRQTYQAAPAPVRAKKSNLPYRSPASSNGSTPMSSTLGSSTGTGQLWTASFFWVVLARTVGSFKLFLKSDTQCRYLTGIFTPALFLVDPAGGSFDPIDTTGADPLSSASFDNS